MRKHILESLSGSLMSVRRILGEIALVLAMALTASWLLRG
jgi:hypothetical protein